MAAKIYRILVTIALFPLSLLGRKNTLLFYSDFDYADSTRIVFEQAIEQGYQAIYLSKTGDLTNVPEQFKQQVIKSTSLKAAYYVATSKVLFLTHGVGGLPLTFYGLTIIQFWHGVPFKKILLDSQFDTKKFRSRFLNSLFLILYKKRINLYDYIISTGVHTSQIFSSAFGVSPSRVLNFGSPRHQKMAEFKKDRSSVKKVLYLPTWREDRKQLTESCAGILSADFQDQLIEHNIELNIRFHPFDQAHFCQLFNNNPRILKGDFDLYEQFSEYDAFVVDYSSVAFDLSTVTENVVFFLPDSDDYQAERELYVDMKEVAGELCAQNRDELLQLLSNIKANKNLTNNIKKLKFIEQHDSPIQNILNFVETNLFK